LAGKHYQKANCCLFLQRKEEAIEHIQIAINIHENPEPEKDLPESENDKLLPKPAEKELGFSRIQYQSFLCSALFM
jgi:hypothetical protein